MKKLQRVLFTAGVYLFCGVSAAFGQAVFGNITGTVRDPSGSAVVSAKVTVTDLGKGIEYPNTTNESGNYSQTHLILGVYQVRVEAAGFQSYVQKNVNVEADATTQVNITLTIGSVGETVNVSGEVPVLKTERADVSDTITSKQVTELPVFGRDLSRLYFLVPGVQANGTSAPSEQPQDVYRPVHRRPILGRHLLPTRWHRQPRFRFGRTGDHAESGCHVGTEDHDYRLRRGVRTSQSSRDRRSNQVRKQSTPWHGI